MRRRIRRVREGACGRRPAATLVPRPQAYLTDEAGQGLRPPKGRTWARRGRTPVVKVTARGNKRVSIAALIATRPGTAGKARLIYRTHLDRGSGRHRRKSFAETEYARLLDGAHQELGGAIVLVWDYVPRNIIPVLDDTRDACLTGQCAHIRRISLLTAMPEVTLCPETGGGRDVACGAMTRKARGSPSTTLACRDGDYGVLPYASW